MIGPLELLLALSCVGWVLLIVFGGRIRASLRFIDAGNRAAPERWPRLSVIIPACNEEATLEAALGTLLLQRYPDLEIILIDDRSTDRTPAIVDEMAARDPRIKPLHIEELPAGWLGKLHALHVGTAAATGEWLLYSDADVHFEPSALETALAIAIAEQLDHLALMPAMIATGQLLRGTMLAFGASFLLVMRPRKVRDPKSPVAIGVGAFNLVRKEAFDRTPGFEWLKMEVADDVGLAVMIKRHGGKTDFGVARGLLSLEWYGSVGAMVRGLEKNLFSTAAAYSAPRAVVLFSALLWANLGPFVALGWGGWLSVLGFAAVLGMGRFGIVASQLAAFPWWTVFFGPPGTLVVGFALLRSAIKATLAGGIRWRDTFYPLRELRSGRRLEL